MSQGSNEELQQRLEEAEAIIRAISKHEVDAFVVEREGQDQVLVLDGVDEPYRLLTERMQQGAAILTSDGTVAYANRCLAEMLNVPTQSLRGTPFADYVCKDHRAAYDALLERGAGGAEEEIALQRSDGQSIPTLWTLSSFVKKQRILCLIVTDLTLQKRHEAERRRFVEEQAARKAAEQVADVLRASDRRKDEFLAMLGHELRNPLAPLRSGLQLLNYIGSTDPKAREVRDMMDRQVETLIRLVDDLLDVGRVTQGKISLRKERSDLNLIVQRALESCRKAGEQSNPIELTNPPAPTYVDVDVVRITQVLSNLLNNALKFSSQDGRTWVTVAVDAQTHEAVVRVRDEGKGIASEMLEHIFDLFTQAETSLGRSEGGLGIGLTLARRLVEMHGGSLTASSPGLGQGSEFVVRLPLAGQVTAATKARSTPPVPTIQPASPRRVLVVDDNRDATESMSKVLRVLNHEVREAYDGEQTLALLKEFVPDLILLDLALPGISGFEVAQAIRQDPRLRGIYIVALSGYGGEEERRRALASGFDAHQVKPIEFAGLQALLDSL